MSIGTRSLLYGYHQFIIHPLLLAWCWCPERYAEQAAGWAALGASILGGCCGTTPAHLLALRARLRDAPPRR
jgi:hypothetical protein